MKRTNKKGFTIVELVIVIAVIAILAAVLIPTFSGVINKATDSANLQDASNTYKQLLASEEYLGNLNLAENDSVVDLYIVVGSTNAKVVYEVINGKLEVSETAETAIPSATSATAGQAYYELADGYSNVYVYVDTKPTN